MWGDMGGDVGRCGEMWGDIGRCGETWGDMGDMRRRGAIQGDMGRYGEMQGDQAEHQGAVGTRAIAAVVERGGGTALTEGEPAPRMRTVGGDRAVARLRT